MLRLLFIPLAAALVALASAQDAPPSRVPSEDNAHAWAAFIRPNEDELGYEAIGWRNSFWPAVEEARELGRPILLWTMNGHPLGCT